MNLGHTEGILLASVLTCMIYQSADASLWLNLEEEMKRYIDAYNSTYNGSIFNWGFTSHYSYWQPRDGPDGAKVHPVTAEVDWMGFDDCDETSYSTSQTTDCMGLFKWSISEGINGSFSFREYTTLPKCYNKLPLKPFQIELNGLNITLATVLWDDDLPAIMNNSIFYANCKFDAKIDFDGYFAYVLLKDNASFEWVNVSVTALENATNGLQVKDGKLTYFLRGTYEEKIWCDEKHNKTK
uniref:Putative da-p36 protein n=1 Tax=Rhipicephalus pulchellus TaxID=72859 RepID=L7LR43_RHIPC